MKWSRYNILFNSKRIGYTLFNTRTLSLSTLDEITYKMLNKLKNDTDECIKEIDEEDLLRLQNNKILTTDDEDDNLVQVLQYKKQIQSYCTNTLGIIVCPTLSCNFACPYCYEHNLSKDQMSEQIQDKLIEFINKHKEGMSGLVLNWHGGEPLAAFETIKQLYKKIENSSELGIIHSSMVTNGYLLNEEKCRFLESHHLDYIQITIDGKKETHDKTRRLKNGGSSYDTIIHNIDIATKLMPNCKIGIRTNISKVNKDEYIDLYQELSERWKGKNCSVYHAFVLDNNIKSPKQKDKYDFELSPEEKNIFESELAEKGIISKDALYPHFDNGTYTCMDNKAFVISPKGNIFKCWADVGIEGREIGNLEDGITKMTTIAQFMTGSDKFSDNKCRICSLLPICSGGCNLCRIGKGCSNNVCDFSESGLIKKLETYIGDRS
jgi:uncharacterized protein